MDTFRQKVSNWFGKAQQEQLHSATQTKVEESSSENPGILGSEGLNYIDHFIQSENPPSNNNEPMEPNKIPAPDQRLRPFKEVNTPLDIDYEMEFIDFMNRNAPKGFSKRFMDMLPYLELSLLTWPTYWLWRGYNWQSKRNTEQLGVYIQKTYQHAKAMQIAILFTGLIAVTMVRSSPPGKLHSLDTQMSAVALNPAMGVQSYVKEKVQRIGKSQVTSDEKSMKPPGPPPTPNLGEDVRLLVNSSPFDNTFTTAAPFLCASVGAWSGYWVFRGLDYHSHRAHIPLPIYIRQTFYQAKLVQFLIILAGTFTVLRKNRRMRWMPTLDVGK